MLARDYTTDNNPTSLVRGVMEGIALPDYTACDWPTASDVVGLNKTAFADPVRRLFPVHTKVACFASALYCAGADDFPSADVVENIKKAAEVHGIIGDVQPVLDLLQHNKQASENAERPDTYALQDGVEHAFYPIGTTFDIEQSAYGVNGDIKTKKLPMKFARSVCAKIVKRAQDLGLSLERLPPDVCVIGFLPHPDVTMLFKQAAWRERLTGETLYKEAVENYALSLREDSLRDSLDAWEQLDAMYGVKTSATVPSIKDCWCVGTPDQAIKNASLHTVWFGSEPLPAGSLSLVPDSVFRSWYAGEEAEKVAAVFDAAKRDGEAASALLDAWTPDQRAVLAGHLHRYHDK